MTAARTFCRDMCAVQHQSHFLRRNEIRSAFTFVNGKYMCDTFCCNEIRSI